MKTRNKLFAVLLASFLLTGCSTEGIEGPKGEQGEPGLNGKDGTNGRDGTNGKDGKGILSILKASSVGNVDTYVIVYSDGTSSTFTITNGVDGQTIKGEKGDDGHTPSISIGDNGNWIIDGVDSGKKSSGEQGIPGLSAYEVFLKSHPEWEGTEEEWVETYFHNPADDSFVVSFLDFDNTVLYSTLVDYGEKASYVGEEPVRLHDLNYEYRFIGWDKDFQPITSDTLYFAQYEKTPYIEPVCQHIDLNKDHICDNCGEVLSTHYDFDIDHECDYCGTILSQHRDLNKDHYCDICGLKYTEHLDEDKDHYCDICELKITDHIDENKDHYCDICEDKLSEHIDLNTDHKCDYCGFTTEHFDDNKDHKCDYCNLILSEHSDNNKDCFCDYCGKALSHVDTNKDGFCDVCSSPILSECFILNYDAIAQYTGTKTGYDAVSQVTSIGKQQISFTNVCLNNMNSESKPMWETPNDEKVKVVQFKSPSSANGRIELNGVNYKAITIKMLSSYEFNNEFKVTFDGEEIPLESCVKSNTPYMDGGKYPVSLYTLTFKINSEDSSTLIIENRNAGAQRVESIIFKGHHVDEDHNHTCDICGEFSNENHKDTDLDGYCDYCFKPMVSPITAVSIYNPTDPVYVGSLTQLVATVTTTDDVDKSVIWSVDKENLASISSEGILNAKAAGTVVITAASSFDPSISDNISIEIKNNDIGWGDEEVSLMLNTVGFIVPFFEGSFAWIDQHFENFSCITATSSNEADYEKVFEGFAAAGWDIFDGGAMLLGEGIEYRADIYEYDSLIYVDIYAKEFLTEWPSETLAFDLESRGYDVQIPDITTDDSLRFYYENEGEIIISVVSSSIESLFSSYLALFDDTFKKIEVSETDYLLIPLNKSCLIKAFFLTDSFFLIISEYERDIRIEASVNGGEFIKLGESAQINVEKIGVDIPDDIVFDFYSENSNVATVSSDGIITAVGAGMTYINILSQYEGISTTLVVYIADNFKDSFTSEQKDLFKNLDDDEEIIVPFSPYFTSAEYDSNFNRVIVNSEQGGLQALVNYYDLMLKDGWIDVYEEEGFYETSYETYERNFTISEIIEAYSMHEFLFKKEISDDNGGSYWIYADVYLKDTCGDLNYGSLTVDIFRESATNLVAKEIALNAFGDETAYSNYFWYCAIMMYLEKNESLTLTKAVQIAEDYVPADYLPFETIADFGDSAFTCSIVGDLIIEIFASDDGENILVELYVVRDYD